MLVGGFAVSYHGSPRTTTDIDFWIAISPENAAAVVRAIRDFGFSDARVNEADLQMPGRVLQMGREPMRIDLLTAPDGVEFDACFRRVQKLKVGRVTVPVISKADLIKNKLSTGRLKDLQDVETLRRSKSAVPSSSRRRPRRAG